MELVLYDGQAKRETASEGVSQFLVTVKMSIILNFIIVITTLVFLTLCCNYTCPIIPYQVDPVVMVYNHLCSSET